MITSVGVSQLQVITCVDVSQLQVITCVNVSQLQVITSMAWHKDIRLKSGRSGDGPPATTTTATTTTSGEAIQRREVGGVQNRVS